VKKKIDSNEKVLMFVDDYTAWVTNSLAETNIKDIQRVILKVTA